ncbi:MAG: hypothetical protein KME13_14295 [Myxacorys californica WJT36-NPBG1]|jgi:hypothetical protein|nr:hypothetical protein [Myxacorys californica WJT36-NPBG1]
MVSEDSFDTSNQWSRPVGGIFITQGMTVGIPAGGFTIKIDEKGELNADLKLHVHYDVCPVWLKLAFQHLLEAEERNKEVIAAWKTPDNNRVAQALESEFESGMQAIMSGAIAVDAFYASVKDKISLPEELTKSWSKNKTARNMQIAEVMRRAFLMGESSFHQVRDHLKEIMRLRGMAVHPSGKIDEPILHPELHQGIEWRFVTFSYPNAKLVVGACLSLVAQLVLRPRNEFESLKSYCNALEPKISSLVRLWEERFGELYERIDESNSAINESEQA